MDDIDIGAPSLKVCRSILRDLDLSLQTRQIRLNSGKTKILTQHQAERHFKIRENELLDTLALRIRTAKRSKSIPALAKPKALLELAIGAGFRRQTFVTGNGEKILKRIINLATEVHAEIPLGLFKQILMDFPGVRSTLFRWWLRSESAPLRLKTIANFVSGGLPVDDEAGTIIAVSVVAKRVPKTTQNRNMIRALVSSFDNKTEWGLFCRLWLLSKYGTPTAIMNEVESSVSIWMTSEYLCRIVAGVYPRLLGTRHEKKFTNILRRSSGQSGHSVLDFIIALSSDKTTYKQIVRFLEAPNTSLPSRISHSKFLMLLAVIKNPNLKGAVPGLLNKHAVAVSDPYYYAAM